MSTDEPTPPPDEPAELPPADDAGSPEPAEAPPEPPELRCAVCDSRLEADQTYCLECGTPTPVAPPLRRGGRAMWIVAAGLVVAGLGAGALAYAVSGEDEARIVPATSPESGSISGFTTDFSTSELPTDPATLATDFPTASTEPSTDTTGTDSGLTDTAGTDSGLTDTTTVDTTTFTSDWQSGTTAFTVIISSVTDLAEAQATAETARGQGESAGVLDSDDHPGLTPGYYVVFSGTFDTRAEAVAHAREISGRFPGANPRRIIG